MEWYRIPGFSSYEISKHTKLVRSMKHHKKHPFHIMKESKEMIYILEETLKSGEEVWLKLIGIW